MLTSPTFCHICMTLHFCLFWPTPYEWLTGNKLALKNIGTQNLFSKQFGPCYLQSSRILSSTVTQKSKHHSKNIFCKKLPKSDNHRKVGLTLDLFQTFSFYQWKVQKTTSLAFRYWIGIYSNFAMPCDVNPWV